MEPFWGHDRRWFKRVRVAGAAAVLEFDFFGIVYELEDLSLGGARLRGPKKPEEPSFDVLLHVADRYLERRARRVWDEQVPQGRFGIEFEESNAVSIKEPSHKSGKQGLLRRTSPLLNKELAWNKDLVLIVDDDRKRAGLLGHALSMLAVDWAMATTAQEAMERLGRHDAGIGIVTLAPQVGTCKASQLSRMIRAGHPDIPQVRIGNGGALREPWSLGAIKMALDRPSLLITGAARADRRLDDADPIDCL